MIVAAVDDLLFSSKIAGAARQAGVELVFARSSEQLLEQARLHRPALVILDLNSARTSPIETASALRADPALRDIPIVAFVAHTRVDLIEAARTAGIEEVLARSAFFERLPAILRAGGVDRADAPRG